jgi:hypothetical protein
VPFLPKLSKSLSWSDEARGAAPAPSTQWCVIRREGKEHSLWENPQTGHLEAVPRHVEIANLLAKDLS